MHTPIGTAHNVVKGHLRTAPPLEIEAYLPAGGGVGGAETEGK